MKIIIIDPFKRKLHDCSMTFQNISALRALGGDVKKNVNFQIRKIRSHVRKHLSILTSIWYFSALLAAGGRC